MKFLFRITFLLLMVQAWGFVSLSAVQAQQTGSYVTPFPQKGTYKVYVIGDSLGIGIGQGLFGAFQRNADIQVTRKSKASGGFVHDGWDKISGQISVGESVDIAVVLYGANDRFAMRLKKRNYQVGSNRWRAEYGRRVDAFIKTLKKKNIAIYWVGLPIMRTNRANSATQVINQIVREKAYLNGVKYIDTWNGFTDQDGGYSSSGPDLAGRVKKLRLKDGVHFTIAGYQKLAHYVEREIRRDISVAKAERSIPLAGGPEEQQRIVTRKHIQKKQNLKSAPQVKVAQSDLRAARPGLSRPGRVSRSAEYGADNSKISLRVLTPGVEQSQKVIQILRPAIPPAVVNHINRRVSSFKASNVGETVNGPMDGGLIATSSITPVSRQAEAGQKRNIPITQTPYYRVLIKGAVLEPKPGRADDFIWRPVAGKPAG